MPTEPNHKLPLDGLTIAVVGAGRIGSELIRNLGLMGVGHIDVFERDLHVADPLRNRYSVHDGDFWDTLTLARLQAYDFAVCTIDDHVARVRMNRKCLVANVSLLQAWTEGSLAIVGAYPSPRRSARVRRLRSGATRTACVASLCSDRCRSCKRAIAGRCRPRWRRCVPRSWISGCNSATTSRGCQWNRAACANWPRVFTVAPCRPSSRLTESGGRVVCLDFEACEPAAVPAVPRAATHGHPNN